MLSYIVRECIPSYSFHVSLCHFAGYCHSCHRLLLPCWFCPQVGHQRVPLALMVIFLLSRNLLHTPSHQFIGYIHTHLRCPGGHWKAQAETHCLLSATDLLHMREMRPRAARPPAQANAGIPQKGYNPQLVCLAPDSSFPQTSGYLSIVTESIMSLGSEAWKHAPLPQKTSPDSSSSICPMWLNPSSLSPFNVCTSP